MSVAGAGILLPDRLDRAGDVPADDLLDATACAWTALRFSRAEAVSLGDPPEVGQHRRLMAVWY